MEATAAATQLRNLDEARSLVENFYGTRTGVQPVRAGEARADMGFVFPIAKSLRASLYLDLEDDEVVAAFEHPGFEIPELNWPSYGAKPVLEPTELCDFLFVWGIQVISDVLEVGEPPSYARTELLYWGRRFIEFILWLHSSDGVRTTPPITAPVVLQARKFIAEHYDLTGDRRAAKLLSVLELREAESSPAHPQPVAGPQLPSLPPRPEDSKPVQRPAAQVRREGLELQAITAGETVGERWTGGSDDKLRRACRRAVWRVLPADWVAVMLLGVVAALIVGLLIWAVTQSGLKNEDG